MHYYYVGLNKVAAHSAATIKYSRKVAVVTQWWAYETRLQKIRLELRPLTAHQKAIRCMYLFSSRERRRE